MKIILVEDKDLGGYTGFLKELPDVVTEGETIDEVQNNLADAVYAVIKSLSSEYIQIIIPK